MVIWCAFQRVDDGRFGETLGEVVAVSHQFAGYRESNPVKPLIYELCAAEYTKWQNGEEAPLHEPYAMERPYYFFDGNGTSNYFRKNWK